MSSHHDQDNHSTEPKEVSFRTPLIMALVTVLIILLAVSTCDKKHGEHGGAKHSADIHATIPAEEHAAVADSTVKVDTLHAEPIKIEEQTHH